MSGSYPKATETKFPGLDPRNLKKIKTLSEREKKKENSLWMTDESQA